MTDTDARLARILARLDDAAELDAVLAEVSALADRLSKEQLQAIVAALETRAQRHRDEARRLMHAAGALLRGGDG
jgi:hypothetical protein